MTVQLLGRSNVFRLARVVVMSGNKSPSKLTEVMRRRWKKAEFRSLIHRPPVLGKARKTNVMKTLVVYYSFTRNNELLAKAIRQSLSCDIYRVEVIKPRSSFSALLDGVFRRKTRVKPCPYTLANYDHIVFVAPIWAGQIPGPLKTFIQMEKENIHRYSFITVCSGAPGQKENVVKSLTHAVGHRPTHTTELWIKDLLPGEERDSIASVTGYRISQRDLEWFAPELDVFLQPLKERRARRTRGVPELA